MRGEAISTFTDAANFPKIEMHPILSALKTE